MLELYPMYVQLVYIKFILSLLDSTISTILAIQLVSSILMKRSITQLQNVLEIKKF